MPAPAVFVLGGHQTDFARHWTREGLGLRHLIGETARQAMADAKVEAGDVQTVHVGNFVGERISGQGHLGGLLIEAVPELAGTPAARHEAACASGSIATLSALAQLQAGFAECALVVGAELMRSLPVFQAQQLLDAAAIVPDETAGVDYPWPHLFDQLLEAYVERYGFEPARLHALSAKAFGLAAANPRAQARGWRFDDGAFGADDIRNPVLTGRIRRYDASPVTDGGAGVVLASESFARRWAEREGLALEDVPRIAGWGHRTDVMGMQRKLRASEREGYVAPHVRGTLEDAWRRAGLPSAAAAVDALGVVETHDCFTVTEYMAVDHFGLEAPGEAWRAIEAGDTSPGGRLPFNPGGGLLGIGHPVGATGVRMVLDVARQLTGESETPAAPDGPAPRAGQTLNLGGSATTMVSLVLARG